MKRDIKLYLQDIIEGLEKIEGYTKTLNEQDFLGETKTQDAVLRNLEIIGEAVKYIPQDFRNRYSDIPWKEMAGMRDVLIHVYFGVNLKRVWRVIKRDLPVLKKKIVRIYEKIKREQKKIIF